MASPVSLRVPQTLPQRHGLTSTTFCPPLLDGSLTFGEICDSHLINSPDHVVFVYHADDDGTLKEIRWKDFVPAIHRAGHHLIESFGIDSSSTEIPTVAILATSDNFTFFAVAIGITRAECTAFFVSPRNSPPAIAHLLAKTKTKYLLVTKELIPVVAAVFDIMKTSGQEIPEFAMMPTFPQLFNHDKFEFLPPLKRSTIGGAVFIIHSSGSTAFPKPITWTHYAMILSGRATGYGVMDFADLRLSTHAIPMFHGIGMGVLTFISMGGMTVTSHDPASPVAPPNPDSVYAGAVNTKSDLILTVPIFIESWSQSPRIVEHLSTIKGVLFGGGPLNRAVGNALTNKGVTIYQLFASSEGGSISITFPDPPGVDWEYFHMSPHIPFEMIPDGTGAYELILLRGPSYTPCVFNTNVKGVDAYATNDLFVPHPNKKGYWRVIGRVDDQIMHNSGEKTNPGPLEAILVQDPHIQSAVMFGRGKFNAGVIIDPAPQHKFDPSDTEALAEFRRIIWPTVEKLNDHAPQHSRIFKEMILVASPSKPFVYTPKMAPRKPTVIADYEPEIEAVYEAVKETTQAASALPKKWTPEATLEFVRSVVGNVLEEKVVDDNDIFQHGCDSLQATWIRNSILHALQKTTNLNTREIESMFVYQNPSILALTRFVLDFLSSSSASVETSQAKKVEEMLNLATKYSENFVVHQGSTAVPPVDIVLITGTTGAIGSAVLAELVKSTEVARVFAFNRKGTIALAERQKKALEGRGLDPVLVDSPKLVLVEAELAQPKFGVNDKLIEEMRSSVTHIIHIAWRVDFNLNLRSFENSIQGVRNLIDLALSSSLSSPPRFLFASSIAVLRQFSKVEAVPEAPVDAERAVGFGYGESKWVSEKILSAAGSSTALRPTIVRIGQVSGGVNGCWNPLEWLPSIVQSAALTNCLPTLNEDACLIPLDLAGTIIAEIRDSSAVVLHLAHPKSVPWDFIFGYIAKTLGVPLVPYSQWFARLEASESEQRIEQNPALRLLGFYRPKVDANSGNVSFCKLVTEIAENASPVLRNAHALGEADVQKWLDYWKAAGVISI